MKKQKEQAKTPETAFLRIYQAKTIKNGVFWLCDLTNICPRFNFCTKVLNLQSHLVSGSLS